MSATIEANKRGIREQCSERALLVDHLPYFYAIHLSMPCNQRCIMCVPNFQHARDTLSFEDFEAFFDQVKGYAEHINLIGGETLMYPRIAEVLELLSHHPVEVTLTTNAFMLNERVIPGLLGLHALNLKCSIDAATPETYHRIRGRDHFAQATARMREFSVLVADRPRHRMMVNFVVMRENLDEVVPFVDLARDLGVERINYMPVANVADWKVENGTGWDFDGREQSCQFFTDEFNETMRRARARCDDVGIACELPLF